VNDSEALIKRINDEIIDPIFKKSDVKKSEPSVDPLLSSRQPTRQPPPYNHESHNPFAFRDPLRDIGRGDLDPFGRGGGMIFQPSPMMPFGPQAPSRGPRPFG
jgi:hypothetical protein